MSHDASNDNAATRLARSRRPAGIWEITNPAIARATIAPTFHGRDILAPAAAHLLKGRDPAELGPVRTRFITLRNFDAAINGGGPFAGKCYIFKGDSYIRYDWQTDRTDPGYPKKIADFWSCMPPGFTGDFEAALEGGAQFSGRGYFFKGTNYIRYSWAEDRAE